MAVLFGKLIFEDILHRSHFVLLLLQLWAYSARRLFLQYKTTRSINTEVAKMEALSSHLLNKKRQIFDRYPKGCATTHPRIEPKSHLHCFPNVISTCQHHVLAMGQVFAFSPVSITELSSYFILESWILQERDAVLCGWLWVTQGLSTLCYEDRGHLHYLQCL